ncbi:MAG: HAD-IA family hydrolase [Chitinophagaceae bacterium]|nr:HAD-IA family hydrolase [Chitinophagaceae bacterium]
MINDQSYHVRSWHHILNILGANISLERMKEECYGKNHELLERIFPKRFSEEEKTRLSFEKEKQYQEDFRPHLKLLPGLRELIKEAYEAGIKLGIGSAAIQFNIDFILDGLNIRKYFNAIVGAEDVTKSKPHPETFLRCAEKLGITPNNCLVFEDAPKGAEAALYAGMDCIIITTFYTKNEFSDYPNIRSFINDYNEVHLIEWKPNKRKHDALGYYGRHEKM